MVPSGKRIASADYAKSLMIAVFFGPKNSARTRSASFLRLPKYQKMKYEG
jgi:hypothetical protein